MIIITIIVIIVIIIIYKEFFLHAISLGLKRPEFEYMNSVWYEVCKFEKGGATCQAVL